MTPAHPNTDPQAMLDETRRSGISLSNASKDVLRDVRQVLELEAGAITTAAERLDDSIVSMVDAIYRCQGRVIVTGRGKMSCIARKATATFCSTGTPSVFLHPGEAVHGDLGIVSSQDVLLALSNSGETREVLALLPHLARIGVDCLAITSNRQCSLGSSCKHVVETGVVSEADGIAVAPTNSTTVTLAICDGLAVALMKLRGFTAEQFAIFHPGGYLGSKLLIRVTDLMHSGGKIPIVRPEDTLREGIATISAKGLGAVFIVDDEALVGVVTDGDLRRIIEHAASNQENNVLDDAISDHMNQTPKSIRLHSLAAEAIRKMEDSGITVLPVTDELNRLVGVIHLHQLIRAGLA